jgi:hypothetical protein
MRIIEVRLLPGLAASSVIATPLPAVAAGNASVTLGVTIRR